MRVSVVTLAGNEVASIILEPTATTRELQLHLAEVVGVPVSGQRLVHRGGILAAGAPLADVPASESPHRVF